MGDGYAGKSVSVDLSRGSSSVERYPEEIADTSLGGFGANNLLFREFCDPGTPPLSDENTIILGAGPLVGTAVPGASRVMANSRLPLTGAVASASGSMGLGVHMKWSGFDHVIIRGRSERPTILVLDGGDVSFEPADNLWGLDIPSTTRKLWRAYPDSSVLAIGPSGENRVSLSLALIDGCATLGRGGLGAVLGYKNLKALVVRGNGGVAIARPRELEKILGGLYKRLDNFALRDPALELGMIGAWPLYAAQLLPPGASEDDLQEAVDRFGPESYLKLKKARVSCPSCFLADKDELLLPGYEEPVLSTSFLNAAILGCGFFMKDAVEAASTLALLDGLGLDFFTLSNMANFLLDMAGEGEIETGEVEGIPLSRGGQIIRELAAIINERRGPLGEALAEGWEGALEHFGKGARRHAILIRGQDCLYDPRVSGLGTMEFEQVVSPRGPTSATGGSATYIPGMESDRLRRLTERMGAGEKALERIFAPPRGLNVGRLTRYSEDWFSLFSSLGICNRHQINRFYHAELVGDIVHAVTGRKLEVSEMMEIAAASWESYRELNSQEGLGEDSDRIPDAWFEDRPVWGRGGNIRDYFGNEIDRTETAALLSDYYDERSRGPG